MDALPPSEMFQAIQHQLLSLEAKPGLRRVLDRCVSILSGAPEFFSKVSLTRALSDLAVFERATSLVFRERL
jgi:hypothetical protein